MNELIRLALPAIMGLISGIVGSLIAPWIHWGIEKRRIKLGNRRDLIAFARGTLDAHMDKKGFRELPIYSQLRPFPSSAKRYSRKQR